MAPQTTVFCAVYSKDPNRESLLKSHHENLMRQTVRVEPIYVFEANDPLAQCVPSVRSFVSSYPMGIYEAWNLAVAMARTPFVMNLNLDDRLNFDAVERLEGHLESERADLVGGDWKVCFTQDETDNVAPSCFSIDLLEFDPQWPPVTGKTVRLGSGNGSRGTYGPATMWRTSAHLNCPRYPYRTSNGEFIRSIGDAVWWTVLRNALSKRLARLPEVIGNYFSHPSDQAEFRYGDEWAILKNAGISRI